MSGFSRDRDGNRRRVDIPRHAVGICHSDGAYSRGRITSRRTHLMPNYGATPAEAAQYGNNLNLWQSLMLLQRWSPLIGFGQRFVGEIDPYKKGLIVTEMAEWAASQTQATADDQFVRHLADMLKTKEGESFVRFILLQVEAVR